MSTLRRIAAEDAAGEGLHCSFCGRTPAQGSALVAGSEVFICDECIAAGSDLLTGEAGVESAASSDEEADDAAADESAPRAKDTFFRLLTDGDVAALVSADDLIEAMELALRKFSAGDVVQPVRTVLPVGSGGELFAIMPACVREPAALGAKLVTIFGRNAELDLPTHLATVLLFSPETGALLSVLGGRYITAARTAAVSAVSANLLARDDAARLAIVGSGVQARSHLQALERIFEWSEVRVWSPTPEHQASFLDEMKPSTSARLVGADSAEQAVQGADVVVLATSAAAPVVQSEWISAGAHVISVGACRPDQREMDPALVQRGRLFVDSRAAALIESGDIMMGIQDHRFTASHIVGELGEVIAGKVEGRRSPRDVTIFKSVGLAVEDVLTAALAYQRALAQDAGQELEL
jgi:alanine dehydrogenase